MPRYKLTLEYDGQFFSGWQRQQDAFSVQQAVEEAILKLTGQSLSIYGAGRTDRGVHAKGQVAHVDSVNPVSCDAWRRGLNFYLHDLPVRVIHAVAVDARFHARFSAISRSYRYIVFNRPSESVLEKGRVWWVYRPLCLTAMQQAAAYLKGHHDFSSFRSGECQAACAVRTLDKIDLSQEGSYLFVDLEARSFLHHQVRIIMGSLKKVGDGSWRPEKLQELLEAKDRRLAGPTAPPEGLYLTKVGYP